jgi:hypothetical protein
MKKLLFASFAAALLGLAYSASPTSAAPAGPAQVASPDSGVEQARMMKKKRMTRRKMRRGGMAPMRSSTGSNVSMPGRRVPQTGTGGAGGAGGGGAE